MLRDENRLLHRGKVEEADALSTRIGRAIASSNSQLFDDIDAADSRWMWKKVREVTGGQRSGAAAINVDSIMLNDHYSSISTDSNYTCPKRTSTCSASLDWLTPTAVSEPWIPLRLLLLVWMACPVGISNVLRRSLLFL